MKTVLSLAALLLLGVMAEADENCSIDVILNGTAVCFEAHRDDLIAPMTAVGDVIFNLQSKMKVIDALRRMAMSDDARDTLFERLHDSDFRQELCSAQYSFLNCIREEVVQPCEDAQPLRQLVKSSEVAILRSILPDMRIQLPEEGIFDGIGTLLDAFEASAVCAVCDSAQAIALLDVVAILVDEDEARTFGFAVLENFFLMRGEYAADAECVASMSAEQAEMLVHNDIRSLAPQIVADPCIMLAFVQCAASGMDQVLELNSDDFMRRVVNSFFGQLLQCPLDADEPGRECVVYDDEEYADENNGGGKDNESAAAVEQEHE